MHTMMYVHACIHTCIHEKDTHVPAHAILRTRVYICIHTVHVHSYRWMVQGYPVCCDFAGTGKACSAGQPCLPPQFATKKVRDSSRVSNAYLGDGAATRRPRVLRSSRPPGIRGSTFEQKLKYFQQSEGQQGAFVPETGWVQVCVDGLVHSNECPVMLSNPKQPGANWFKARFGHSVVVISGLKVIVYGGFTCYNETCEQYSAMSDTWELDLSLVQSATEAVLTLRELSPAGSMVGGLVVVSAGDSNVVYVTGGTDRAFGADVVGGRVSMPVTEPLQARKLIIFENKMSALSSTHWPAMSGHSAVANRSMAIMFGGFIGNTMTSGVFTYTFSAPTGDNAFAQLPIRGSLPESRGFAAMSILGSESFVLNGGIHTYLNDSGIGSKRVALGDFWNYSFVTARWTQIEGLGNSSSNALGASTLFKIQNNIIFLNHGGIPNAYVPGLSAQRKRSDKAQDPFPYGPGRQQPTSELKALLPEGWTSGSRNRWIRVKPKDWNVKCMSLQPLCNEQTDDYWSCTPAPYPWWIDLGKPPNRFSVDPCSWSPPTAEGSCAKLSDPETQLCTTQLPPSMICEPQGRFMHSLTAASFKSGQPSALLYGGTNMYGKLLADAWLLDLSTFPQDSKCTGCGFLFRMALNVNVSSLACEHEYVSGFQAIVAQMFSQPADTVHVEIVEVPDTYIGSKICEWHCNADDDDHWELKLPDNLRNKPEGERVKLIVSVTEPFKLFSAASKCTSGCDNLFKEAVGQSKLLSKSTLEWVKPVMKDQTLEACAKSSKDYTSFLADCLQHQEARVDMIPLDDGFTCEKSCSKVHANPPT